MSANQARNEKRIKDFKRIAWAKHSIQYAYYGCNAVLTRNLSPEDRTLFSVAVATSYVNPFTEANGLGKLDISYETFPDKILEDSHLSTLRSRHELFVHRDQTSTGTTQSGNSVVLHKIFVNIDAAGDCTVDTLDIKWDDNAFTLMKHLCEFQLQRLHKNFCLIFADLKRYSNKGPGRYELGKDFP
jgi:hypothetical protein